MNPHNSAPSRWFCTVTRDDTDVIACILHGGLEVQCSAQAHGKSVAEPEALRMSLVFKAKYPPSAKSRKNERRGQQIISSIGGEGGTTTSMG